MTKTKKLKLESVMYWVARVFSVALSFVVILFLIDAVRSGINFGSFSVLLLFSLLFIVPGISIFIYPKISIWIYSILDVLLILSAIFSFTNWTVIILPVWISVIIILLALDSRNAQIN